MRRLDSKWTPVAAVLAFFFVIGSLEALSLYVADARVGRTVTLGSMLKGTLPSWIVQLSIAWPVGWLSRHARLGPDTWLRRLPLHLLGAFLFSAITVIGTVLIFKWTGQLGQQPMLVTVQRSFFAFLANQVAMYGAMVGMFHALDYLQESEQRERERARLAASLTEARLNALRSQLSPHFFFNTLNAISTFSLQGRPGQVTEMVGALGDLVRASLDDQLPHQVPLKRELELLDLYLDIQRVRFADWLRVELDIEPRAVEMLVPSLVLQPLIENAIEHGGQSPDGLNHVRLRVGLEGEALLIEITNPLADLAPARPERPRLGVGLRNTRERLEQLYPGEHAFRSEAAPGHEYVTTIRIPARRAATAGGA
ncbi:MAG: histidine kinase [Candidatus Eisenbacteria bacterium]|uniref:Histidine kinase n=1 Tax=Eiseniibacteriota bacterium TaxID=2212470 RepID=A0A849T0S0_UNCEI|nr:histidine kinase [Candidatus Eisenbacteria bacterium]